jgi:hypothetical protein
MRNREHAFLWRRQPRGRDGFVALIAHCTHPIRPALHRIACIAPHCMHCTALHALHRIACIAPHCMHCTATMQRQGPFDVPSNSVAPRRNALRGAIALQSRPMVQQQYLSPRHHNSNVRRGEAPTRDIFGMVGRMKLPLWQHLQRRQLMIMQFNHLL